MACDYWPVTTDLWDSLLLQVAAGNALCVAYRASGMIKGLSSCTALSPKTAIVFREDMSVAAELNDVEVLAGLGYKQELKRAFRPLEVVWMAFSVIGLFPSIT